MLLAAVEARAALRDITHEGAGLTTHAVMASRVDLAAAAASLGDSLTAGVDLAHVLRDAVQDPQLTVAARAAHTMATSGGDEPPLAGWVHAGDLHHNREITVPVPARQSLPSTSAGSSLRHSRPSPPVRRSVPPKRPVSGHLLSRPNSAASTKTAHPRR